MMLNKESNLQNTFYTIHSYKIQRLAKQNDTLFQGDTHMRRIYKDKQRGDRQNTWDVIYSWCTGDCGNAGRQGDWQRLLPELGGIWIIVLLFVLSIHCRCSFACIPFLRKILKGKSKNRAQNKNQWKIVITDYKKLWHCVGFILLCKKLPQT